MKKFAVLVVAALMFAGFSQAQGLKEGSVDLNLGLGFTSSNGFIPIYFGGDYMIKDFISIGAEVQFRIDHDDYIYYGNSNNYASSGFALITRADYHFNTLLKLPEEFDVYAGVDLGYAIYSDYKHKDFDYEWNHGNYFLGGPHAGGRWMFASKFGLNAELGGRSGDGAYMKAGLTFLVK